MNRFLYVILFVFVTATYSYSQSTVLTGGNNFSVGLCGNGAVYAWGSNASGQIGQGTASSSAYTSPTKVIFPGAATNLKFVQVNAGSGAHGLALDCNGHVWVWGENECGQVGNGTSGSYAGCTGGTASTPSPTPAEVLLGAQTAGTGANATYLHSIKLIGGGNNFSIAVDSSGNVWTWGENQFGELGDGTSGNLQNVPTQVVKCSGGNLTNIVFVQGGDQTAYALDANGEVWAWGKNDNNNLGNGTTGNTNATGNGAQACAGPVYKGTSTVGSSGASAAALGLTPLTGIKQIAAGDTHGMALDSSGQVWTWGGDWAPGQLGQGYSYIPNAFASRVVAPLDFAASTNGYASPYGACTGCTYITGAKFIAAGQASSAVVLSTGNVVTFGGQGLYPGSACGTGQLLYSGTLGNGLVSTGATCQANNTGGVTSQAGTCTTYVAGIPATAGPNNPPVCAGYGTPTYVLTSTAAKLSNIVSVARGDAWYFATDINGNTYAWGFNGASQAATLTTIGNWGGELGIGNTTDQTYAVPVTLPTNCGTVAKPCPDKPGLGANFSTCAGTSFTLDANEPQTGYTYKWYSSSTGTAGSFTQILPYTPYALGVGDSALTTSIATTTYFAVQVDYAGTCGTCSTQYDTVKVSLIEPVWTAKGTFCTTGTNSNEVQFTADDPAGLAKFVWYTNATGGSPIAGATGAGSEGTDTIITLLKTSASLNTSFAPTCPYALFVTDTAKYTGALEPSTTGCNTTSNIFNGSITGTNSAVLEIYVSQANVTLTSAQFWLNNGGSSSTANYTFSIYANGTGNYNCGSCTGGPYSGAGGAASYTSPSTAITQATAGWVSKTITGSYTFPAVGYYWISLNQAVTSGNPEVGLITCPAAGPSYTSGSGLWTTPWTDNTGYNIMKGVSAAYQSSFKYNGPFYNLIFTYSSPYTCSRLLACATQGSCPLPVKFLAFTAEPYNSSVDLNWSTASEENSSYFDVQRSMDGENFTSIGKVNASGNSSVIKSYGFTDNNISELNGVIYYRIVEHDIDGSTTISTVQSVSTGKGADVKVIPNPNNGSFTVVIEGEQEALELLLYNSLGQVVYISSGKAEGSTFSQSINVQNLPAGLYYLNVQTPSNTWVKKVIKE